MPVSRRRAENEASNVAKKIRVDPMVGAVIDAINMSEDLPASCKGMLAAMVPEALPVPAAERHEHQRLFVDIVGGVIGKIEQNMQTGVAEGELTLGEMGKKQQQLTSDVEAAQALHSKKVQEMENEKEILAARFREVLDKRAALASAKEARQAIDMPLIELRDQMSTLESAITEDLVAFREGTSRAKDICNNFVALSARYGLEETLAMSLPSVCEKLPAERGTFDVMVLSTLETSLRSKAAEISELEKAKAEEARTLDAAVNTALRDLEEVTKKHHIVADTMTHAMEEEKDTMVAHSEKTHTLDAFQAEVDSTKISVQEKKEALESFQTWNVDCYKVLKDKQVIVKPDKIAADSVEITQPVDPAEPVEPSEPVGVQAPGA